MSLCCVRNKLIVSWLSGHIIEKLCLYPYVINKQLLNPYAINQHLFKSYVFNQHLLHNA